MHKESHSLSSRNLGKEYPLLLLALGIFIIIQAGGLYFHEPWADEIQAWLLARDSTSLWKLLSARLRYEASPGLWHTILWVASHFSTNLSVLNICSSIIATLSCALILFASPLPLWIRLFLPFSYYFGYQFSIVARNYCVISLGMLLAATIYPKRFKYPLIYVLALVAVANSAAHGILIASAIAITDLPLNREDLKNKASLLKQTPVFILGVVAAILQMLPLPLDIQYSPPQSRFGWHTLLPSIDESLVGIPFLSLLILISSIWIFYKAKILMPYLISAILLEAFFVSTYWMRWHSGVLFLVWVFCIFQCYDRKHPATNSLWWKSTMVIFLSLTVFDTARALKYDIAYPICSLKQAAKDLKDKDIDINNIAYIGFLSQPLRAYFPPTPGKPSYWISSHTNHGSWSINNTIFKMSNIVRMFALNDDYLYPKNIICADYLGKTLEGLGYRPIKNYQGTLLWRGKELKPLGNLWMERIYSSKP